MRVDVHGSGGGYDILARKPGKLGVACPAVDVDRFPSVYVLRLTSKGHQPWSANPKTNRIATQSRSIQRDGSRSSLR